MSSIRLLLLGVLLRRQPIHGYDVRRELEQWHADRWANIAYGSIYSALGKMADEGLVEAVNADQSERQSARTEYTITERGKAEFEHLLHEYWGELKPTIDPFQIALTFMDKLSPAELLKALHHRADQLHTSLLTLQHTQPDELAPSPASSNHLNGSHHPQHPRHLAEGMRLMIAHIETELRWIREVICKVERGDLP